MLIAGKAQLHSPASPTRLENATASRRSKLPRVDACPMLYNGTQSGFVLSHPKYFSANVIQVEKGPSRTQSSAIPLLANVAPDKSI